MLTANIQTTQITILNAHIQYSNHTNTVLNAHSQYSNHTSNHWLITVQTTDHSQCPNHTNNCWMITGSMQTTQTTTDWSQPVSKLHNQLHWMITASIQTTQATTDWPQHKQLYWLHDHGQCLNHTNNCTEWSQLVSKPHKQPLTDHSTNNRIDCMITASV